MDPRASAQQLPPLQRSGIAAPAPRQVPRQSPALVEPDDAFDEVTVSAFVCEKPVSVSINRVRGLVNRLQGILKPNLTENAVFPDLLPLIEDLHRSDTVSLLSRLNVLIDSVYIPPALPAVLFGKLTWLFVLHYIFYFIIYYLFLFLTGPLPLQPSKNFKAITHQTISTSKDTTSGLPKKIVSFTRFRYHIYYLYYVRVS